MAISFLDISCERARAAAAATFEVAAPDGRSRKVRLAIGDPQAPLEKFLGVLDSHHVLGANGLLLPDVFLVSMGNHFDWGKRDDRDKATADGTALLAWLAAHPPDQVVILLGNHDLGRVGELVSFDDRTWSVTRGEADLVYGEGKVRPDSTLEGGFRRLHPALPTAEIASRDFSTFAVAQRKLVESLLRAKRFRIAHAESPTLFLCHAGVTKEDLDVLAIPAKARLDARKVADALNAALDSGVTAWDGRTPFAIRALHTPGNAAYGEGRGMFYHRPSNPAHEESEYFAGPPRRRFDPRRLPRGLVQAIGHIRDGKCRKLLVEWADGAETIDGPLRHLVTDGNDVRYARGVPKSWNANDAGMIFLDGGMSHVEPAAYEILDLTTVQPAGR